MIGPRVPDSDLETWSDKIRTRSFRGLTQDDAVRVVRALLFERRSRRKLAAKWRHRADGIQRYATISRLPDEVADAIDQCAAELETMSEIQEASSV